MTITYPRGAERPALEIWWVDDDGGLIDFSTGYTFELKLGTPGSTAILTKTTGITGAAGAGVEPTGTPNITVAWAAGELDITPGGYVLQLVATTGGLDRIRLEPFEIAKTVT